MKRLSTIIMALALVLGMSQCKKQETPTTGNTTPTNPGVHITVNVGDQDGKDGKDGKDNNGEKHNIAPQYGLFSFSSGDVLYVGHNGEFVGTLKFKNGFFDGIIYPDASVTDQPLHFFFLGNSELKSDTIVNETTSLSINIADQSTNLPVLSYGASNENYTGPNTIYSTTLKNKCALVRFDLQNQVDYEVTLSNVPTLATVNFANPTAETAIVATEGQTNGNITLYGEEGNTAIRWAILLPGTNLSPTVHTDLTWNGEGDLPVMGNNTYINSGLGINNPLPVPDPPAAEYAVKTSGGMLTQFSVSANKKVYFSRANLKYTPGSNASNGTWDFHDSQIDECYGQLQNVGNTYKPDYVPYQSKYQQAWVQGSTSSMDRFCWGYNDYTIQGETDYITGRKDLSRTFGTDWGCAFPEGTYWRTPTASEWDYLLNGATRGNKRFMMVEFVFIKQFNGKDHSDYCRGLLLFPDDFVEPEGLHRTYQAPSGNTLTFFSDAWYNKTDQYYIIDRYQYSTAGDGYWNDPNSNMYKLLAAGCVFLPAVGMRAGGTDDYGTHSSSDYYIYDYYKNVASGVIPQGYYWTASCDGYETWSKYLWIGVTGGMYYAVGNNSTTATETFGVNNMMANVPNMREIGMCVRLVWDAN